MSRAFYVAIVRAASVRAASEHNIRWSSLMKPTIPNYTECPLMHTYTECIQTYIQTIDNELIEYNKRFQYEHGHGQRSDIIVYNSFFSIKLVALRRPPRSFQKSNNSLPCPKVK